MKIIDFLKHPLLSVIIGFLLTGVVGTYLTNHIQKKEKKILLQKEAHKHLREFSQSLALRVTEARYLKSAFIRNIDYNKIENRKISYDKAVKNWNIDLIKHLFIFREYSESRNKIFFERNIEMDLIPILYAIDVCLTEEFDSFKKVKKDFITCWISIDDEVKSVKLNSLITSAELCGYEISNLLFSWISVNIKSTDTVWKEKNKELQNIISLRCNEIILKENLNIELPPTRSVSKI